MAFESKRLRVQLPCGETTVVDHVPVATPPLFCGPWSCQYGYGFSYCNNAYHTVPHCINLYNTAVACPPWISWRTAPEQQVACLPGSVPPDPGVTLVDPEVLPAMREQLEAQLAEIAVAEKALRERQAGS